MGRVRELAHGLGGYTNRKCRCDICVEGHRAYQRDYYARNAEKGRESARRWRERNPEKARAMVDRYQAMYPDKVRATVRKSYLNNPVRFQEKNARRRALKLGAPTFPFTVEQLEQKRAYYGNRCWMCGGAADTDDHVKPLVKGGAHMLANLRPACRSCNSRKGTEWPYEKAAA